MPLPGPEAAGVWLSVSVTATLGRLLQGRARNDNWGGDGPQTVGQRRRPPCKGRTTCKYTFTPKLPKGPSAEALIIMIIMIIEWSEAEKRGVGRT